MEVSGLFQLCLSENTANLQERFHIVARNENGKLLGQDAEQDDACSPYIDSYRESDRCVDFQEGQFSTYPLSGQDT